MPLSYIRETCSVITVTCVHLGRLTVQCLMSDTGDIDGATGLIERCLEVDQTSSDSHILMAQVSTECILL